MLDRCTSIKHNPKDPIMIRFPRLLLSLLFIFTVLPATVPAAERGVPEPTPVPGAKNWLDVPYLPAWRDVPQPGEFGWERQVRMNIARPDDEVRRPAVILVHGGGYTGGHKDQSNSRGDQMKLLVDSGFVAVNTNYPLGGVRPQAFYDFHDAVRYLREHADEYGIDPGQVGAWGFSAGGWLISSASFPEAEDTLGFRLAGTPAHGKRFVQVP